MEEANLYGFHCILARSGHHTFLRMIEECIPRLHRRPSFLANEDSASLPFNKTALQQTHCKNWTRCQGGLLKARFHCFPQRQTPSETVGDSISWLMYTVGDCAFGQIEPERVELVIFLKVLIGIVHPSFLNHPAGGSLFPPPTPAHLMRPDCEDGTTDFPISQRNSSDRRNHPSYTVSLTVQWTCVLLNIETRITVNKLPPCPPCQYQHAAVKQGNVSTYEASCPCIFYVRAVSRTSWPEFG